MEFLRAALRPAIPRPVPPAVDRQPGGLALAAVDERGRVVGALLGALDPAAQLRAMVRRHGLSLTFWLVVQEVTDHSFRRELLFTRLSRYVPPVWYACWPRAFRPSSDTRPRRDGVLDHPLHQPTNPQPPSLLVRAIWCRPSERSRISSCNQTGAVSAWGERSWPQPAERETSRPRRTCPRDAA